MTLSRVYITQQPVPNRSGWMPNLTSAEKYGALEYVFEPEDYPYLKPKAAMAQAARSLRDFNQFDDYILWPNTGDPAAAWAVMLTLARKGIHQIKTLYYERGMKDGERSNRDGFYSVVTFTL